MVNSLKCIIYGKKLRKKVRLAFHQITFSRLGLGKCMDEENITLGDYTFDNFTMREDRKRLGDHGEYYDPFRENTAYLDGVFTIAGSCEWST